MTKTTQLVKLDDGMYEIKIPEEYVSKLDWKNGYVLKIDTTDNNKLVIERLSGFMGM